ncbi:hypothetical protein [Nostoc sp.]
MRQCVTQETPFLGWVSSQIDRLLILLPKAIAPSHTQNLGVKRNAHWCQLRARANGIEPPAR